MCVNGRSFLPILLLGIVVEPAKTPPKFAAAGRGKPLGQHILGGVQERPFITDGEATMSDKPTKRIQEALDELCDYNDRTKGKTTGAMYLGKEIFVAVLKKVRIIEGEWSDTDSTVDMMDLIRMHQDENQ